jgi:CO/xanthine dehydrogenase FAD-binding subunit
VEGGVVRAARLALGAVAPIPLRATGAETYLAGKRLDGPTAAAAAALAVSDAAPLGENRYKAPILQALVRRALESLADR